MNAPHKLLAPDLTVSSRLRFAVLILLALLILVLTDYSIDLITAGYPAFDQAWFLYAADRALHGVTPYGPHLTEVNPPLMIWFSIIPVALGRLFHLSPLLLLKLITWITVLVSAAWCTRILRAVGLATSFLLSFLSFSAVVAAELSLTDFLLGQREQFLVILALPYALYAACLILRFRRTERIALGIASAIGLCFKPQHVLIVVALEFFLLLYTRDLRRLLRAELLAFTATICTYVLLVYFATPYVRSTVPILTDTFWAYGYDGILPLLKQVILSPCLYGAMIAWVLFRKFLRYPVAPLALIAAGLGGGIAFALQANNWENHYFPFRTLMFAALGWIFLDLVASRFSPITRSALPLVATFVLIVVTAPFVVKHVERRLARDKHNPRPYYDQVLASLPPGTTVYMFNTGLGELETVYAANLVWGSRYAHVYMVPAIVENERALAGGPPPRKVLSAARLRQLTDLQRSTLADDFFYWKPTVVIVPHCGPDFSCQALGDQPFDFLGWFLKSPAFAAQWSNYHLRSSQGLIDVYARNP